MKVSARQINKTFNELKTQGGFSRNVNRKHRTAPTAGYMVSIPGYEQQIRSENVAPAHIDEFVRTHADQLEGPNMYAGGWDSGAETSLDVSQNIKPKKSVARKHGNRVADADARTSAMDMSLARNQEAAWDVKGNKDVVNKDFDPEGRRGNA